MEHFICISSRSNNTCCTISAGQVTVMIGENGSNYSSVEETFVLRLIQPPLAPEGVSEFNAMRLLLLFVFTLIVAVNGDTRVPTLLWGSNEVFGTGVKTGVSYEVLRRSSHPISPRICSLSSLRIYGMPLLRVSSRAEGRATPQQESSLKWTPHQISLFYSSARRYEWRVMYCVYPCGFM